MKHHPITLPAELAEAMERATTLLGTIDKARNAVREAETDLAEAMVAEQRASNILSAAEADTALDNAKPGALKTANSAHDRALSETDRLERLVKGLSLRLEEMQTEVSEVASSIRPALSAFSSSLFENAMDDFEKAIAAPLARVQAMAALNVNGNKVLDMIARLVKACGLANTPMGLSPAMFHTASENANAAAKSPEAAGVRDTVGKAADILTRLDRLTASPIKVTRPKSEPGISDHYIPTSPWTVVNHRTD